MGIGGDGHVFEDFFLVPDVVAGGDDVGAEIEEFFCERGGDAEAAGGVFAVDDEEVYGVRFEDVGEMFADDVAAGRAEDVADEENVHFWILRAKSVMREARFAMQVHARCEIRGERWENADRFGMITKRAKAGSRFPSRMTERKAKAGDRLWG